jgi:hypothetical protein
VLVELYSRQGERDVRNVVSVPETRKPHTAAMAAIPRWRERHPGAELIGVVIGTAEGALRGFVDYRQDPPRVWEGNA